MHTHRRDTLGVEPTGFHSGKHIHLISELSCIGLLQIAIGVLQYHVYSNFKTTCDNRQKILPTVFFPIMAKKKKKKKKKYLSSISFLLIEFYEYI